MSDRLTKQELSWLLTQEARGAAERLRKGVQILTTRPTGAPPPDEGAASLRSGGSERPITLSAAAGEEGQEGLESTLDLLEGTMQKLSELAGPASTRPRRGRVDLAALLWEIAPDAKVQLAPGAGTEVFADEAELRRMLHVFLGAWTQSGVGGAQLVTLKREGDEIRLGVQLGPDTAPIAAAERGWLARMAIRFGGRYELDGSAEFLLFPADDAHESREVENLRKELEAAKAQGEMYARELAAVFGDEPERAGDRDESSASGPDQGLSALARVGAAFADDLRAIFGPLGAARLRVEGSARDQGLIDEVGRTLVRGAELLTLCRQLARLGDDKAGAAVDLTEVARDEAKHATVAFAARGVVLVADPAAAPLVVEGWPAALRALVAEIFDRVVRGCVQGDEVRLSTEGRALVVERIERRIGPQPSARVIAPAKAVEASLHEIARAHRIALEVTDSKIVARLPEG